MFFNNYWTGGVSMLVVFLSIYRDYFLILFLKPTEETQKIYF